MPVRSADAVWEGDLKTGKGKVKVESGTFDAQYSFSTRFENGKGTNPEELIAAAHSGCFAMALSAGLGKAGFTPTKISTTAKVTLDKVGEGFKITLIKLHTEAVVPKIDEKTFAEIAAATKSGCPISQALSATKIESEAKLVK